ncbi:MAG: hypothetical protein C0631_05615 [Sedimenticola sp.]|nr:MAG: hypothetical protein C0631_05615 [Sedimenticola sp.]
MMKAIAARLLHGVFCALLLCQAVYAESPGPLPVNVFVQTPEGERNPLPNVRIHLDARYSATNGKGIATFEGLPAGTYNLTVKQPDYDTLTQQITVPPGARQGIELTLTPAVVIDWSGQVDVAGLGKSIAGVNVELQPLNVKAALSGPAHSITTWDGRFEFLDIPVGRYRLRATAPGFETISREVDVVAGDMTKEAVFDPPLVDDVALDVCREWGQNCHKPAADRFCQDQNYFEAAEHKVENDKPPTRIITSGKLCEHDSCDRIVWIRCIGEKREPLALQLQPVSKSVNQSINITDRVSGKPVSGASIILAETWPSGHIAEAKTDTSGSVHFKGLKIGDLNGIDDEGNLSQSRRRITARVEAEGYETTVVPVVLSENPQAVQIKLIPLTVQEEVEPNNDFEQGQEVHTGAPVSFKIAERADHDFFKFRLSEPTRLVLTVQAEKPFQTLMRLRDNDGKVLTEKGAYENKPNVIEKWIGAGSYSVEISEWGDNAADPEGVITLTIAAEPAVDPSEPNQSVEEASPIALNQEVSGLIWPMGDNDFYRLDIDRYGILSIRDHHKTLQRHVKIYNQQGEMLTERGAYENHGMSFEYAVTPGVYILEVKEWGDNQASLTPYRMSIKLLPDDGVVDPVQEPGVMRAVRTLSSHTWFASTLLPLGDQDVFSVPVPGAGVLRVQSKGPMQRHIQVYDSSGKLLKEQGAYENHTMDFSWHAGGPQTVFVLMREWGDNSYSALPYSMRFWFERGDEVDFQQRNDDFDNATPLLPGDIVYGSFLPMGDKDFYAVDADFPGVFDISVSSAHQTHMSLYDSKRRLVTEKGAYENHAQNTSVEVIADRYYLAVNEWGSNSASTEPYELKLVLKRAEPTESVPLAQDQPRMLRDGEAQSFTIDHMNDLDRFMFESGNAGEFKLSIASQIQTLVRVFNDKTGKLIHESGHYEPVKWNMPLKLDGPTRLRIELSEWGGNNRSGEPGFIMIDSKGRMLHAEGIEATPDGTDPEQVAFRKLALKHAPAVDRCELDLNGDGRAELTLTGEQAKSGRFPKEGRYQVESRCFGPDGQTSREKFWVQATGNRAREGIALFLTTPYEGQVVDQPMSLSAQAISYSGRPVSSVSYTLDGRHIATDYKPPFDAEVNWQSLKSGEHSLLVTAQDTAGKQVEIKRNFKLSEYFGLSPPDGAVLSGESIRVSWLAPQHGESQLRYRKQGSDDWQTARGQSGQMRVVELRDLEAAVPYEIQPMGGKEPGPVQSLTRVKGLAFGQPRYGANIKRDYDQRVGISVRNNGDEPLSVRLECGKPKDPLLLVGFVGEGSEDKPIPLGPGEARQFLLGISAQDVDTADHTIPIRIVSDTGLSDEAEVAVHVRLPHVELEWQDLGPLPLGHGHKLRLHNRGDTITDLQVSSEKAHAVTISPTVQHGLLNSGRSQDFTVIPRFYEGFQGVKSQIQARGLSKVFSHDYEMKLGPGESARRLWLFPGEDPTDPGISEREPELIENAGLAERLDPQKIDWTLRENPEDLDRDGRSDRWSMIIDNVRWVGEDTNTDDIIDFIHADVGDDGIFEYSAIKDGEQWSKTNLVEAWLEMGFSLPWNRDSYHPHNTDIVLNGRVIGSLQDVIPEGNYSFRIPPDALQFDKNGLPGNNIIGINSKHLRGGHYVINSDFRFKFRLTATPVWTVAKSEDEARQMLANMGGVAIAAPDLSLSSSELWLDAPTDAKAGDDVSVEIPVSNLGSVSVQNVVVALFREMPGRKREEITRVVVEDVTLHGGTLAKISWKAAAGSSSFMLVADPDNQLEDLDTANNEAVFYLPIKGEVKPIKITFNSPTANSTQKSSKVSVDAVVNEEIGAVQSSLSIDGGLWTELPPAEGKIKTDLLLQPGDHRLELRVTDGEGNSATEALSFKVAAPEPQAQIIEPKAGASIAERHAHVVIKISDDTELVGVRAAGGPWHRAVLAGTEAHVDLPLRFGNQSVEAMVVNSMGVVKQLTLDLVCTAQPKAGEERVAAGASEQGLLWPDENSDLAIDLFQTINGVMQLVERPKASSGLRAEEAANTAAMDPKMRARYEQAKRLRADGAKLQAQGRLPAAVEKYQQSLRLYPDYRLEAHIRLIEGVLGGSAAVRKQ